MKIKKIFFLLLFLTVSITFIPESNAQCPMCRASAESSMKEGSNAAKGLNKGVLYMLAAPYLLVGFIGFIWYKNRKRVSEAA